MNIDYFREYLVLAELLNYTKASIVLHEAQPTLTRHIDVLEKELGVSLFNRESRPISLTGAGLYLREDIESLISSYDKVLLKARQSRGSRKETILLGAAMDFRPQVDLISVALPSIEGAYHYVETLVKGNLTLPFVESLVANQIDIAFTVCSEPLLQFMHDKKLGHKHLHSQPFVALIPHDHPLASKNQLEPSDLFNQNLALFRNRLWPELYQRLSAIVRPHVNGTVINEYDLGRLDQLELGKISGKVLIMLGGSICRVPLKILRNCNLARIGGEDDLVESYILFRQSDAGTIVETVADEIARIAQEQEEPDCFFEEALVAWRGAQKR